MNQLIQILLSVFWGFVYGMVFKLISKRLLLVLLFSTFITIIYVLLMYYLNNGIINYILKISIILGFIINYKVSNLRKKG